MQKVILYIQPQLRTTITAQDYVRVDLMEEDLITLTQVIQDVKSIDKIFTDYSRTFNLPASKTNNKIFKYWYNPDVEGFDNQIMANARIELNHFAFKEGKIRLESVTMKHGKPSLYKVTFFGNTITLNDLIGEDKINNLDWLNNFNHINNDTNVKDGLENGLNFTVDSVSYPDAIIYPLLTHTQQYIYDTQSNFDHGGNLSVNATNRTQRGVLKEDLKPAILVKHIIKAIEEQYSLTFKTSEFFQSAAMNNLFMWLHREKDKLSLAGTWIGNSDAYTCSGANCAELTSGTSISFNTSNGILRWLPITGPDVVSEKLIYTFTVTPAGGYTTIPYKMEIVRSNNWSTYVAKDEQTGTQSITFGAGAGQPFDIDDIPKLHNYIVGRVTTEDTFQFQAKFEVDYELVLTDGTSNTTTSLSATFTSNSSALTPQDGNVIITDNMPDIKILDFLNGLFKMFNLTAFINFDDEIVVKSLDEYYSSGQTHDLTEYIKTDSHNVNSVSPYDTIEFEHQDAKTILANAYKNVHNKEFGSLEYTTDLKTKKQYKVKTPFEHMLYERLNNIGLNTLTTVQYGLHTNINLEPFVGKPLLFYGVFRSTSDVGVYGINYVETTRPATKNALCPAGTRSSVLSYWMPHNYSSAGNTTTPPTYNLNFGSEINSYDLTDFGANNNSLFQNYYQNYITRVFNKKTRLYRYSAILPLKVLLQLTLDDKVIVGTRIFTINSMTTKLQSGETEFELLNEAPE